MTACLLNGIEKELNAERVFGATGRDKYFLKKCAVCIIYKQATTGYGRMVEEEEISLVINSSIFFYIPFERNALPGLLSAHVTHSTHEGPSDVNTCRPKHNQILKSIFRKFFEKIVR
jgi:hypothetical protein